MNREVQDEQRDGDREHAVAERLQPPLPKRAGRLWRGLVGPQRPHQPGLLLPPHPATASSATAATNATGRRINGRPARSRDGLLRVLLKSLGSTNAAPS